MSGAGPNATQAVAPAVARTTSTTSTQPENQLETASPRAENPAPSEVPSSAENPAPSEVPSSDVAQKTGGIEWEDLENLTLEMDGDTVRLEGGRATISFGGASANIFTLQNRVAQGDLDGDGDEDVVAHIVERTAGTGVFHFVVPVIDDEGTAAARQPVWVGDRVVMDRISVQGGLIQVSLFDRALDEPYTIISRHTMLEIDVSASEPVVTVVGTEPIEDLPVPGPERPEIDIRFDPGAVSATQSGSIHFRERQTYTVQASAGQAFTAALDAPLGVWLDIRLDDHVVTSAAERSQLVETELAATGLWETTVVSSHAWHVDYELIIEVLPVGEVTPASTTTEPAVRPPFAGHTRRRRRGGVPHLRRRPPSGVHAPSARRAGPPQRPGHFLRAGLAGRRPPRHHRAHRRGGPHHRQPHLEPRGSSRTAEASLRRDGQPDPDRPRRSRHTLPAPPVCVDRRLHQGVGPPRTGWN